jgi:hypothetical protein
MGKRTPIAVREDGSGVRFETCVRHERRTRVCGEGEGVYRGRSVLLQHTWTTDVWPVEGEER